MGKSFVHQENPVVTGIETYTEKTFPQNLILPWIIGQDESFPGAGVIKEKTEKPLAVITVI